MDYEKKYKDALTWVGSIYPKLSHEHQMEAEAFLPELAESEDEKIIKEIISIVKSYRENCITEGNHSFDACLAWLEKQGEQKEIDYNEELKKCKANPLYFFDKYVKVKFKEQTPSEWSEEDEKMLNNIINLFLLSANTHHTYSTSPIYSYLREIDWLKNIKQRIGG